MRPFLSITVYSSATSETPPAPSETIRRSTSVEVRPSRICTVRATCSLTIGSCVTIRTVVPSCSAESRMASSTSAEWPSSSSPVGSSASSTDGAFASAVAIATRCCCPPESWAGRRPAQSATPSRSSSSRARSARAERRAIAMGRATFSAAVRNGSRLRDVCWNTKPTAWRRKSIRWRALIVVRSSPATRARPPVGLSSPERMFSRVDLPEPDAPTSATTSPGSTVRLSPCSACTSTPSVLWIRTRSSHQMSGPPWARSAAWLACLG